MKHNYKEQLKRTFSQSLTMGICEVLDILIYLVNAKIKNRYLSFILDRILSILTLIWIGLFYFILFSGFGILPLIFCIYKGYTIWSVIIAVFGFDAYREFIKRT